MRIILSLTCVLLLCGCFPFFIPPPGKGPTAMMRYHQAKPLIAALETYHKEKQSYPHDTKELVPGYLDHMPEKISYTGGGGAYALSFRYVSVCMNTCTYTPQGGKWDCFGYC